MPSLQQIAKLLSEQDPILGTVIATYTLSEITPHTNYYEALIGSIISQQLSVKAAATIKHRFVDLFGGELPTPTQILTKTIDELRGVGLSRPKAGYMQDLASKILDGTVQFNQFDTLTNEEIIQELTAIKGVGEWTAHMFLMFSLGRLDVLPVGDLGIRNGVRKLYSLDHVPSPDEVIAIAQAHHWHPYESVASRYIWQSLDNVPKL